MANNVRAEISSVLCKYSTIAQAIERPSNVAVPRPISSNSIRLLLEALFKIFEASFISTKKVLSPPARLSLAPTLVNNLSTIPINAESATNVTFKLNGSNVQTTAITDNGNTNQKIQYISYSGSADEIFVESTIRDSTIIVQEVEECKYTPIKITFINKNGALQDLWFFKKSVENMNVTKNSFNRNLLDRVNVSYTTTEAAKKTYDINANESISINSGFVNEAMNVTFEELLVSNLVWMTKDSTVFPMKVADSSLSFKTSLNDKLINYAINFEYAFDLINNVH